ncbi:MAG: hypothetical protein R3F61_34215 [Myxococcota bacterium]
MTAGIRQIRCAEARTPCVSGDRIAVARRPEGAVRLGGLDLVLTDVSLPFPVGRVYARAGGGFHAFGASEHAELGPEGQVLSTGPCPAVVWGAAQSESGALWVVRHDMRLYRKAGQEPFEDVGAVPVPRGTLEHFVPQSGCVVGPEGVWSLAGERRVDLRGASRVHVDASGRLALVVARSRTGGWTVRVLDLETGSERFASETAHVLSAGTVHDGSVWMAIRDGFLQWRPGEGEPVRYAADGLLLALHLLATPEGLLLCDHGSLALVPWEALGEPVSLPPLADLSGWPEAESRVFRMLEAQARKHVPADVSAEEHIRFRSTRLPDLARVLSTAREIEMVLPLLDSWSPVALVQRKSLGLPDSPEALASALDHLDRLDPAELDAEVAHEIDRNLGPGVRTQIEAEVRAARERLWARVSGPG